MNHRSASHASRAGLLLLASALAACAPPRVERERACDTSDTGEAVKQCPRGQTVRGVDVSYHQGRVDWPAARAGGVAFGFARVSDGSTFVDPEFAANYQGMKQNGVVRGTYQYFRPAEDPVAQADVLIREIRAQGGILPGDLPPALDIETTDGVPSATLQQRALVWLGRVEAAFKRTPLIYTSPGFWQELDADPAFARYPLWVAHWDTSCPTMPGAWSQWRFWQDSDGGSAAGISGAVDTDRFDGTMDELRAFARGGTAPVPRAEPAPKAKPAPKARARAAKKRAPASPFRWADTELARRARQLVLLF